MNTEPLVSAIIIFLDEEKYLEEAIESVFAQTYPNWELLLCDDGSTDDSTEIAQRYAERFPHKVRYLEHEGHQNRGMSATRNLGLGHAKGEYIAWLDADDVWLPQKLQRQVEIISGHPEAALVYGPYQYWYSWTGKNEDYHRDFTADIGVPSDTLLPPPQFMIHILQNNKYVPGGELVRRTVLEEVGGFEVPFPDAHEDDIVYAKIGLKWPVFASGESWYWYRQHEDSYCARARRAVNERSERLIYLDKLVDHLRAEGHDEGEVWQVVQDQIRTHRPTIGNAISESVQRGMEKAKSGYWRSTRLARQLAGHVLPQSVRGWLGVMLKGREYYPPIGWVHFGGLRRVTPIHRSCDWSRGTPCDRYYIEKFLAAHESDIRGRVLEIGGWDCTLKFGGDRVTQPDVLHARPGNPRVPLIGDLCTGEGVPANAFDCLIITQEIPFLWDFQAAITNATRALKPGGVMLVTLPGNSHICRPDTDSYAEIRRFTSFSVKQLFEEHFDSDHLEIKAYGNVLAALALLHGLVAEELSPRELDHPDPDYEMIITVRALKSEGGEGGKT